MRFFLYDNVNEKVIVNEPDILLIREFKALLEPNRNKSKDDKTGIKKERAFKELKYIYLFFDWQSPYFQYNEQDRHFEVLADSDLNDLEFEDPVFREACRKYDNLQNSSREIRLLKAAMESVDNIIEYLQNIDLSERDPVTGKPIFKTKELILEIKGCKDVISTLRELEQQVKKGMEEESGLRGNAEGGLFD